ncbi:MAG TPA: hypothetical protein VJM34_16140 [Novosphingobium sp.]|nr:hypothetical protein [Novosphingobium sp.]
MRRAKRNTSAGAWLIAAAVTAMVGLLAFAWIDGGAVPLRTIAEPVAVPGAAR